LASRFILLGLSEGDIEPFGMDFLVSFGMIEWRSEIDKMNGCASRRTEKQIVKNELDHFDKSSG
jgi:hypothetical protein